MKRGFTLIELLAVIVILAIISLIAVPVVINIINDSKKESISRSVDLYIDHVQKVLAKEQMTNPTYTPDTCEIQDGDLKCFKGEEELTTSNGTKILKVEMNGKKPSNGTIKINNNKISYKNVLLENIYHHMDEAGQKTTTTEEKSSQEEQSLQEEQVITIGEDTTEETGDTLVTIQSGPNKDKAIKKGTVITIGTENFYVYKYSNNIVYAIAKYNLKVGGVYNDDTSSYTAYTPSEVTNLQDPEMRGYIYGQSVRKGTTLFSSSEVHGTNYSSYEGSIVEGYVNEYKSKLEAIGAEIEEARLITKEELEGLGCSSSGYTCSSAPSFIYSTSYWSGSANNTDDVWIVYSDADFDSYPYTDYEDFGVRPVIGISISEI